jgi:serine-type D-Ala-D-Ala endopeptidase (penicillin-binding protein 7)
MIRAAALAAALGWAAFMPGAHAGDAPKLRSAAALIVDAETGEVLYNKNAAAVVPIASITKLMTAVVVLDAGLPLDAPIEITREDLANTRSARTFTPLNRGVTLTRDELLRLALMASENRAAVALGRTYPGGLEAFVQAMNETAAELGMNDTRFVEPTGLSSENVSSAADLAKLVIAARGYPLISEYSTAPSAEVRLGRRNVRFVNTNTLVRNTSWEIGISKTGFIRRAGRCLVMEASMSARSVVIVLLDSVGKYTRIGDANRIRKWLDELGEPTTVGATRLDAPAARVAARRHSAAAEGHIGIKLQAATLR